MRCGFAGKWSHFEESLRVPFIIYDPRLERNRRDATRDEIVLNIDIAPTLLDLAGIPAPIQYEGKSVMPLIGDSPEDTQWRDRFHCEHLTEHSLIPKWRGIRSKRYVYTNYFEQNPNYIFLHDLEKDPDQLRNLANDPHYEEILQELRRSVGTD